MNALEKKIICGDPEVVEWQNIPLQQAKIHLQSALQSRGYFYSRLLESEGMLVAHAGPQTLVKEIFVNGFSYKKLLAPYHKLIGRTLTPELLNEVESYIRQQLWRWGYPCAPFFVKADPDQGAVFVEVQDAKIENLIAVKEGNTLGIRAETMSRYQAFNIGEIFNSDLLELTTRRMVSDGIVQSARFAVDCTPSGVVAKQFTILGKPRLITVGIGANNERFFILKLSWKSVRLGENGSSFKLGMLASFKNQELEATGNWYPLTFLPSFYLQPALELKREEEKYYEMLTNQVKLGAGSSWDWQKFGVRLNAGPVLNSQWIQRGIGPRRSNFLSTNAHIEIMSHDFEFYRMSPRNGFLLDLSTTLTSDSFLSPLSAYLFSISGEYLFNFRQYQPPLVIFGLRGKISTTVVPHREGQTEEIPILFRHFLGGVDDVRGFARKQLPYNPQGGLTSFFLGGELRSASVLHEKFQPLVFVDTGWLGQGSFELQKTLYWSPGVGFRYESLIGTFRGIAAHGFVARGSLQERTILSKMQFFLSYGQEF